MVSENDIIKAVRSKKQLAFVDDEIIQEKIEEFLQRNPKIKLEELSQRSSDAKDIIKYTRQQLHDVYTVFQTSSTAKRNKYLQDLKKAIKRTDREKIVELRNKILSSHLSTKERMGKFKEIYSRIFAITGLPQKVVDLGAGINAFSIANMGLHKVDYTAVEISQGDCDFINEYFSILKEKGSDIAGKALKINLEKIDENTLRSLNCDICFAFKLFDLLDNKATEKIITTLPCRYFAVSFSKITVGKKKMRQIRRAGFQKMLRRLNIGYKTFETEDELFYVIRR